MENGNRKKTYSKYKYSQNKIKQKLLIERKYLICMKKDFYNEDNCMAVHGCLLLYGIRIGKATKACSYSFNVFHVPPSSVEGIQDTFLIELLELKILSMSTFCINF